MVSYEIAHIREQGQDMIIMPLNRQFDSLSREEKFVFINYMQAAAQEAGLAGTVVPVWDVGFGRSMFIAPKPWHPFFSSISLNTLFRMRNKILRC